MWKSRRWCWKKVCKTISKRRENWNWQTVDSWRVDALKIHVHIYTSIHGRSMEQKIKKSPTITMREYWWVIFAADAWQWRSVNERVKHGNGYKNVGESVRKVGSMMMCERVGYCVFITIKFEPLNLHILCWWPDLHKTYTYITIFFARARTRMFIIHSTQFFFVLSRCSIFSL